MRDRKFSFKLKTILSVIVILWIVEIIDIILLNNALNSFGIIPRTFVGLRGIFLAPFLHGGFMHLASNTLPILILGLLAMHDGTGEFYTVFIVSMIIAGLGTWITGGSGTVHIGASGVVFGLFGYLLLKGYFQKKPLSVITSIAVGILYGGMIFGVLPRQPGVSWQSHLFGFLAGVLCAKIMSRRIRVSY